MMLGFSYMAYYANAYAMNQYLAAHGFTVLSINFRRGIGYGWDFQHPPKGGWAGSSEYQDVLSGAKYLAGLPGVDGSRLGIWGGSYGGLLTALALARDSDTFKAGVDIHGVHDWSETWAKDYLGPKNWRWEQGDKAKFSETAFRSSPVADVATWTSPVLLIHGDDDRNVRFGETINLARRLDAQGVEFEELVIPDDIHDFLRYSNWLRVYEASADFLTRKLGGDAVEAAPPAAGALAPSPFSFCVVWSEELETQYTVLFRCGKLFALHSHHGEFALTPTHEDEFSTRQWFTKEVKS